MFSNKLKLILILLTICLVSEISLQARDLDPNAPTENGVEAGTNVKRYIIQLNEDVTVEEIRSQGVGGREVKIIREFDSIHAVLIEFVDGFETDADFEDESITAIQEDAVRQWIHPIESDDDLEVDSIPENEMIPFGVNRIGGGKCDPAKKINATVAIIDTGVDPNNKSLNVTRIVNFVWEEKPVDLNGHGTHVAGIVAAKNNGSGVVGVAPGAKIIALKVLNKSGGGRPSDIIAAIDWVTKHADKVDVVNMSLGFLRGKGADLMHQAIKKSVEKGVLYVVAAGNESSNIYEHERSPLNCIPASYPEVMTVSAMVDSDGVSGGYGPLTDLGADDKLAYFSNFSDRPIPGNPVVSPGAGIDVAAPGVDILSTAPRNKYKKMSGTSMASPYVAGVVARYIAKNRKELFRDGKNAEVVYKIRQTLIDHAEPQSKWNQEGDAGDPDINHEGLIQIVE